MTATKMHQEQFSNPTASANGHFEAMNEVEMPVCCGTGCAVCVLDYPELFAINQTDSGQTDCNMLALLEAVEQAQAQANELIANGDLQ